MATTPGTATAAPAGEQRISGFGRIIGVFFSPKETFADIARNPTWLLPTIVLTLTGIALSVVLAQRADWEQVYRQKMEKVPMAARAMEQLTPEQQAEELEKRAKGEKISRYARGAVGGFFLVFVVGLIYWGAFNMVGTGAKFAQARAIVAFGYLPVAVRELLGVPINLMKDAGDIDPENFVASNLAAFLPSDAKLWHIAAGASFDLFAFWCMLLVATGFSIINPKKASFGKALGVVMGVWAFFFAFGVGIAYIFS